MSLTPQATYIALLVVQTAHLLCVPLTLGLPAWLYSTAHLAMIAVQIAGSIWIKRLSPAWESRKPSTM